VIAIAIAIAVALTIAFVVDCPLKTTSVSKYHTLPHTGSLNILTSHYVAMVSLENIMRKGFSKGISKLILESYWEDLDKPASCMFAKVMVTHVDVLGMRAKLWNPGKFQCTVVVFKNLAVYIGLDTDDSKTLLKNFLYQKHNRKYVS
jgi:hypothetical protein